MKCKCCPALISEGYEYPEEYCCIYPEDECIEFKDGELGCRHRLNTIEKLIEKYKEYRAHEWDGIGEFYELELKIEDAMEDATIKACELADIVFASGHDDELYKYKMTKGVPSILHDFVWRFRAELQDLGYEIIERESTKG